MDLIFAMFELAIALLMLGVLALGLALAAVSICIMIGHKNENGVQHESD